MTLTKPLRRWLRLTAPIAALVAVLILAVPAWAGTVQIQDDAHVLDVTKVQNDAATLPVGLYIWTTTQDAASKSTFDTDVRNKVSATFPIVIGINTQAQHVSIQIGSRAGLSRNAALSAESRAVSSFTGIMRGSHDYTTADTSAIDSVRTSLTAAHRGRAAARRAPAHSSGGGIFLVILLVIGGIVVVAILAGRRRRSRSRRPRRGSGPPPMGPYPGDYGPGYGPRYRSGMSPGMAGGIGAVGGGLLGYELGRMSGEEQQFRQDEMMDRDRGGQNDSYDQGDWVVGQDGDFGGGGDVGGDGSGGGGDW
ncbi:MAG: hypothetical protein ACRDSP_04485 [Pseudonocardiaceae bacterium]